MDRDLDREGFRQLFDTAPDAVAIVNSDGIIVLVNQQIERLFDYPRAELVGQPVEVLIPDRHRRAHVGYRTRFTASPQVRPMGSGLPLWGRQRDGSEFPVEISLSPVTVASGVFISVSIRDVTDRRNLESQAKHLHQYLLSAIDSIEGSFFIWDAEDRLVVCNSAARALWGDNLTGEITGRAWLEVMQTNLEHGLIDLQHESLGEFTQRLQRYHQAPEGTFDVLTTSGRSVRMVERRTPEGGTVALIMDVTNDAERERELLRARSAAEAASAAKSEFLSSMSHELRTPLNAVLGFAQLLQRDKKQPLCERHLERLHHILKGGEHLLRLIDDVLDLARIEDRRVPVSIEPVDVASVLREVEETIGPIAQAHGITLVLDPLPSNLSDVKADRTRFKQIVMNYASNAIKYGRKGGVARLTAQQHAGYVRAAVSDDGIGIALDDQERVFEPFNRAGQETGPIEGTGIGLTICKRLASMMEGQVGCTSVEGEGSEFWVDLPALRQSERPPSAVSSFRSAGRSALSRLQQNVPCIVYIEDNPSNVAFMQDLLNDEAIDLLIAPSAEVGIELVRARTPNLVIMDINLPGMSGIEARQRLLEWPETASIPVVALSAAVMPGEAKRITEAGFYRYLTKPVRVDQLMKTLEELLFQADGSA